jgi:hypothetical protein
VAIKVRGGRTLTLAAVGALAASLLTVGGVATASSAAAEVHACVHKKTRYARIVNPATKCRKTEEHILIGGGTSTTNVQGGVQGPKGDTGAQGKQGATGATGPQGPKGLDGKDGQPGKDGLPGKPGQDGKDGLPGKQGETGPQGPKGDKGLTGSQGPRGYTGATGPQGPRGATGPQGPKGEDGKDGTGAAYTTYTKQESINSTGSKTASCAQGGMVTGGGFSFGTLKNAIVMGSAPDGNGWTVSVAKDDNGSNTYSSTTTDTSKTEDPKTTTSGNHGTSVSGVVYVVCMGVKK